MNRQVVLLVICSLYMYLLSASEYLILDLYEKGKDSIYYIRTTKNVITNWADEYKTRYIVFRKIDIHSISNYASASGIPPHEYYIGVFEITQRQWEIVMNTRPSFFRNEKYYKMRPVESVDYSMICGTTEMKTNSFLSKIRSRVGLDSIDLPTEAQWEFACRAGTSTPFNNGKQLPIGWEKIPGDWVNDCARTYVNTPNADNWKPGQGGLLAILLSGMRNFPNRGPSVCGTQTVGKYLPNAFGLYDMHGNVCEICHGEYSTARGYEQVARGGSWFVILPYCTSFARSSIGTFAVSDHQFVEDCGFRLVINLYCPSHK